MSMWIISRGVVLLILLMEYKFQVGYNGFTSHVITTIATEYEVDKDTSQSKQNLQSSSMTCFISSTVSEVKRNNKTDEESKLEYKFQDQETQKTSSALEALWKTLFVLYLYLIGTFTGPGLDSLSISGTKILTPSILPWRGGSFNIIMW
ncbi:hypothetical protein Tco_1123038 [Tanacetum coccineum]|uniref:Uncharacterized protein n=1 Tax=Tanacetum coccineum TaxID=301880 RepID=A0ABQ5J282_9ASTR